jgi:hypothetical protein
LRDNAGEGDVRLLHEGTVQNIKRARSYRVPTGVGTSTILLPPIQVLPVAGYIITKPEEIKCLKNIDADRII